MTNSLTALYYFVSNEQGSPHD